MFGKVLNTPLIMLVPSNDANFQKKQWQQMSYVVIIVRKGWTKNIGVNQRNNCRFEKYVNLN